MPRRILLADGHEGIRHRVRSMLETAGFEVCGEAVNGLEAVTKTRDLTPDLIILVFRCPSCTACKPYQRSLNQFPA